jgi:hypothetical protein
VSRVVLELLGAHCDQVVYVQRLAVDVRRLQNFVCALENLFEFLGVGVYGPQGGLR